MRRGFGGSGVLVILSGLFLSACENAPPASPRGPQTAPATTQPATAPATTQPAEDGLAPPLPTGPSATTKPAEPVIPPYITITGLFLSEEPPQVREIRAAGQRLELETYNVRSLRIDRAQLSSDRRQSIALILDGQGMEWRAASPVVEFERSRNGVWAPVKPDRTKP